MKCIVLLSSGIDSPVAAYLLSSYADELIFMHANTQPFSEETETKTFLDLAKHLSQNIECDSSAYLVSHGPALKAYIKQAERRFTCVFCKRMLLRYASALADRTQAAALVMGDSLGQVASQTLKNIAVIDEVTTLPILRPLIGYDKEEIIDIAKEIGTYALSTIDTGSCQAVPNKPATQAKLEQLHFEEGKIDIDTLVRNALSQANKITF